MRKALAALALLSLVAAAPSSSPSSRPSTDPPIVRMKVPEAGAVIVSVASRNVYIPHAHPVTYYRYEFLHTPFYKEDGKVQDCKEGYFAVHGRPEKITFDSSDPAVMEVKDVGGNTLREITFKGAGDVSLMVHFMGKKAPFPLHVTELPFAIGDSSDDVVKAIGLPDDDHQVIVSWPEAKTVDGIIYAPSASQRVISAHHWQYKAFPGLTVSIVDGQIHAVGSYVRSDLRASLAK